MIVGQLVAQTIALMKKERMGIFRNWSEEPMSVPQDTRIDSTEPTSDMQRWDDYGGTP
jgi:hypothetical protein